MSAWSQSSDKHMQQRGAVRFRPLSKIIWIHTERTKRPGSATLSVTGYVNTSKQVGDVDHLKVFANVDAAETWFEENDPEGVAFEYEVME